MSDTIILADGFNLAFRAFYGMPELTRADGFPTGAIHGWVKTLWWLEDHIKPTRLLVFFDLDGADRQTALREDYKANRSEAPEALCQQIPIIKELTKKMGYGAVEKSGVEADDLIAAYAKTFKANGYQRVLIVSADKDLAQLVEPGIGQLVPPPTANPRLGWRELDEAGVFERFGVKPTQIADYLAIIGDTSDNIPGLKGVGPKTASKWLNQYGNLEEVIAHCGELMPKRFQAVVHAEADHLRKNQEMTRLDTSHELADGYDSDPDADAVAVMLEQLEMGKTLEQFRARLQRNI